MKTHNPLPIVDELPAVSHLKIHTIKGRRVRGQANENNSIETIDINDLEQSILELIDTGVDGHCTKTFQTYTELEEFTIEELLRLNIETNTRAVTDQDMAYADSLMQHLNSFPRP